MKCREELYVPPATLIHKDSKTVESDIIADIKTPSVSDRPVPGVIRGRSPSRRGPSRELQPLLRDPSS